MIRVILLGHRKRTGKDMLANMLVERQGFVRLAYADKLKEVVTDLFRFSPEQINGVEKEVVDRRYGITPRHVLQQVGTEHLRSLYPNIWTDYIFQTKIPEYLAQGKSDFVITDLRFPNEHKQAEAWAVMHSKVRYVCCKAFRIDRPSLPPLNPNDHASETSMANYPDWDGVLCNDGTPEELYNKLVAEITPYGYELKT